MNIAVWLLDRFGVPDAVVGDIIERSRGGKSGWWIWRQTIGAIVARSLHEARRHPWVALRGVALGVFSGVIAPAARLLVRTSPADRRVTLPFALPGLHSLALD
jgi:hypothetical protein